jgi:hypothetical protein
VGDLGGESTRVHEEKINLSGVVDEEDLVASGGEVSGQVVGSVTVGPNQDEGMVPWD